MNFAVIREFYLAVEEFGVKQFGDLAKIGNLL
jgi:hypothetical protein